MTGPQRCAKARCAEPAVTLLEVEEHGDRVPVCREHGAELIIRLADAAGASAADVDRALTAYHRQTAPAIGPRRRQ